MDNNIPQPQPEVPVGEPKKGLNSTVLLVGGLILIIVLIAGGTLLVDRFRSNPGNQNQTQNNQPQEPTATPPAQEIAEGYHNYLAAKEEFKATGAAFKASISTITVSDSLANEFKKSPSYLSSPSAKFHTPFPNYQDNASTDTVEQGYRRFLTLNYDHVAETAFDQKTNIQNALSELLNLLYYMAQVANSQTLNSQERSTWVDSISKGKAAALTIANGYPSMRAEAITFTENLFKQTEFTRLGIR